MRLGVRATGRDGDGPSPAAAETIGCTAPADRGPPLASAAAARQLTHRAQKSSSAAQPPMPHKITPGYDGSGDCLRARTCRVRAAAADQVERCF